MRSEEIRNKLLRLSKIKWEEVPYLVKPWIVEGGYHVLSGYSGFRKSWFALWLAKCACLAGHKVCYIDLENSKNPVRNRYEILGRFDDSRLSYWADWPDAELRPPAGIPKASRISDYLAIAKEEKPFMIFDTLNRFHTANENSSKEMTQVTNFFRELKHYGATPFVLQQDAKPYEGKLTHYRGSSEIVGGADIHWAITQVWESQRESILTLTCPKNRYFEAEECYYMWLSKEAEGFVRLEESSHACIEDFRLEIKIFDLLADHPGLLPSEIRDAVKIQMERLLRILARSKRIKQGPGAQCYTSAEEQQRSVAL